MKLFSFVILALFLRPNVLGQLFNNRYDYDSSAVTIGFSAEQLGNEYVIFCTSIDSVQKITTIRLNSSGEMITNNSLLNLDGALFVGSANSSDQYEDGFISAGSIVPNINSTSKGYLIKWNNDLDTIKTRSFISYSEDSLVILRQAKAISDGFVAVGSTDDGNYSSAILLIKTDFELNELWRKYYDSIFASQEGISVVSTPDHGFLLGGIRYTDNSWDHVIIKTDSLGNVEHLRNYGNEFYAYTPYVENAGDGNFYFGGRWEDSEGHGYPMICKMNSWCDTLWSKKFGTGGVYCFVNTLKILPDGSLLACGSDRDYPDYVGFFLKLDPEGNLLWYRKFVQTEENWCYFNDVIQTSDQGYFLTGLLTSEINLTQDAWGLKLDSTGCLVPGCDLIQVNEQDDPVYFSVYPNPANHKVNVYLPSFSTNGKIHFELYDAQGILVRSFNATSDDTTYILNVETLTGGIYFLKCLRDDVVLQVEKVVKE